MPLLAQRGLTTDTELIILSFVGPGSYVTGGFDPGFPSTGALVLAIGSTDMNGKTTGYGVMGDATAKKVKAMLGGTEVTNGTNLSTFTFLVAAYWKP